MSNFYTRSIYILPLIFGLFFAWGCNTINPSEKVPTYIHIDSFQFMEADIDDINCVWVYYNSSPVGAFDLPATIPIIMSGTGKVELAPGISINGRSDLPIRYPFYTIDTFTIADQPGKIINHLPQTRYFGNAKITKISDFEAGITKFAKCGGTTSIIAITADSLKYEGTGSGGVFLNSASESSVDSTTTTFTVPNGEAFIEVTYKSSLDVALGLQAYLPGGYATTLEYRAGIKPNNYWRKFYFNITAFTTQYSGGRYSLFIKTSVPEGQTSGQFLIDNIKLVTF